MGMLLVPITWSMIAGACLAIGTFQLSAWLRAPSHRAALALGVLSLSVMSLAIFELALMRSETAAEYGAIQRWMHVAICVTLVSIVQFTRAYFGTGRRWLAYTIISLQLAELVLNFAFEPNIDYR